MQDIFTTNYYTQGIWIILGAIPALYIALSILWNRKIVTYRRGRGTPTPYFGNLVNRITTFAFKEDPRNIAPKKANKATQKLLTLKTINWVLLAATFTLIGLANPWAWIPALTLTIIIAIQTTGPLQKRNRTLTRMFAVAQSTFRYGRGSELNPWGYVKIKKWDTLTDPGETQVTFPANWDASSQPARDGFEAHFNTTVTDNNTWIYEWKTADGYVIARPVNHLPERAMYPGSDKHPWNVIPLGIGANGEVTVDLAATPHMLVCGTTGSGKSVLQRNIIFHCIQHNDSLRFLGVDVKRVELKPFAKYTQTVMGIGTNLEDGVEIVRYAKEIMETRYEQMEERGVNHFKDLLDENGQPPYAVLLMVDEAYMFMAPEGAKTDEGKMRDQLHGDASVMLGEIARLGRASGVHLVLATQRPDATVIRGELKANLDIRIAAGRLDATPSSMVLDSGAATQLPGHIKGRGIVRFGGHQEQFQGYFAEQNWIDEWLAAHPGREPELFPAEGGTEHSSADDELDALMAGYNFDDGVVELEPGSGIIVGESTQPDLTGEQSTSIQISQPVPSQTSPVVEEPVRDSAVKSVPVATPEPAVEPKVEQVASSPENGEIVVPGSFDDDEQNVALLRELGLLDDEDIEPSGSVSPVGEPEATEPSPAPQPEVKTPPTPIGGTVPPKPLVSPPPVVGTLPSLGKPKLSGLSSNPSTPVTPPKPNGLSSVPKLPGLPKLPPKKGE